MVCPTVNAEPINPISYKNLTVTQTNSDISTDLYSTLYSIAHRKRNIPFFSEKYQ